MIPRGSALRQTLLPSRRFIVLTARKFRLFISCSFSDFIAEREALQKVLFPEGSLHKYDLLETFSHHHLMSPHALRQLNG